MHALKVFFRFYKQFIQLVIPLCYELLYVAVIFDLLFMVFVELLIHLNLDDGYELCNTFYKKHYCFTSVRSFVTPIHHHQVHEYMPICGSSGVVLPLEKQLKNNVMVPQTHTQPFLSPIRDLSILIFFHVDISFIPTSSTTITNQAKPSLTRRVSYMDSRSLLKKCPTAQELF